MLCPFPGAPLGFSPESKKCRTDCGPTGLSTFRRAASAMTDQSHWLIIFLLESLVHLRGGTGPLQLMGECAVKRDETRGCWKEVKRIRHARDQSHYSCYRPVEMVLHLKMPLACTSLSKHPTTDPGGGATGGRKVQRRKAAKGQLLTETG